LCNRRATSFRPEAVRSRPRGLIIPWRAVRQQRMQDRPADIRYRPVVASRGDPDPDHGNLIRHVRSRSHSRCHSERVGTARSIFLAIGGDSVTDGYGQDRCHSADQSGRRHCLRCTSIPSDTLSRRRRTSSKIPSDIHRARYRTDLRSHHRFGKSLSMCRWGSRSCFPSYSLARGR
jgi:hypothetical protein